jgi:hypothetical protein
VLMPPMSIPIASFFIVAECWFVARGAVYSHPKLRKFPSTPNFFRKSV